MRATAEEGVRSKVPGAKPYRRSTPADHTISPVAGSHVHDARPAASKARSSRIWSSSNTDSFEGPPAYSRSGRAPQRFTLLPPQRECHHSTRLRGGGKGKIAQKAGFSTISSLCSTRERTSEARNRRWPPSVRIDVSFPERAQRLT